MNRALLIGGSGQLGTEIRRTWTRWEIASPSHAELDIENGDAADAFIAREKPDVVLNCAAFHNVDRCEAEPDRALVVNAIAVERLARCARDNGAAFVTISTDYVFDGTARVPYTERDCPRPLSAYAVSKLAGEQLVARLDSRALVVRTCGVYGVRPSAGKGHTFVDRVIAQGRAKEPIRIVNDVTASPTFAGHLAEALLSLIESRATGLYHAANAGPVTWFDFAVEALRQAGVDHPIEPIPASSWKSPARRPAFSALDSGKLRAAGFDMPGWRDGIAAYLRLRNASEAP